MVPTTSDNDKWLNAAFGIIALLWAALVAIGGLVWRNVATRQFVVDHVDEKLAQDHAEDRILIHDLLAPLDVRVSLMERHLLTMHAENQRMLVEIGRKLDRMVGE